MTYVPPTAGTYSAAAIANQKAHPGTANLAVSPSGLLEGAYLNGFYVPFNDPNPKPYVKGNIIPNPTSASIPPPGTPIPTYEGTAPVVATGPSSSPVSSASPTSSTSAPQSSGSITPPTTPAAASSPANQASNAGALTTSSTTTDNLLSNILASLSSGGNASSAGLGSGVGGSDTSLPSPTAADVAALQPTPNATSSSGPNIVLIIGVIAVLGFGAYLWYRHKKGSSE